MSNNLVCEPKIRSWGGDWTIKKLDAFEKYVNAYLTIMNKFRFRYNWELIYFDGFAGSGTKDKDIQNELLLDFLFDEELAQLDVYRGAAERVIQIRQKGFDYYYFIDINEESQDKLKEKLSLLSSGDKKLIFRKNDANVEITRLADAMNKNKKYKSLVLLDPFGMQINWESITSLKDTATDLWILIPSGVVINRLLDRKGELKSINKLTSFFGLSEIEIRNKFYRKTKSNTLFGEVNRIKKVETPIKIIAETYINKLNEIFKFVTKKPLVLRNTRNFPIYHFAFASNNKNAVKIAKQIIEKK